jgi:valyl-tRNA synthetase
VYLHVKGRVDLDAEIAKAKKKLAKASDVVTRQKKLMADPKWQEKVAEKTKETEREKLADQENEVRQLEGTITQFEQLKLEA